MTFKYCCFVPDNMNSGVTQDLQKGNDILGHEFIMKLASMKPIYISLKQDINDLESIR